MAPFPLVKLAIVFFKQISKPLANQIKVRAKNSEFFKKYICMPPAQFYHWYDVNLRMRMLGIETKKVAKMNEEAAVALGADILGEDLVLIKKRTNIILLFILLAVILCIAVGGLALEYARRSKNDTEKEVRHQERLANMEKQLSDLEINLTNQSAQLLELERLIQHKLSPPSKSKKSSSSLPASGSSSSSTDKQQVVNALSIVDISSIRSPLIQLHTTDYLTFPVAYAIQRTNDYFISPLKQWSSLRRTKH